MKKKAPVKSQKISTVNIKNLPIWVAGIVFVLTTTIFFWEQLFGSSFFWEDFVEYVYPTQSFAASEFAKGVVPFWNPYSFVGMPFLADLRAGFFYPLSRILSLFIDSSGKLPVGVLQFVIILHFFISQFSMYYLTKFLKISSCGSLISSFSYAFSLLLVCHVIHPMIVEHLSWFPLITMFFIKAITFKSLRNAIYSGLLFGMTLLSGHPQMTLFEALFLAFLFLWYFISDLKLKENNLKQTLKQLLCGIIPIIIAAGIFSIQYIPSQELANLSQRAEMTYEKASEGSLEIKQIFSSLTPKIFGYIDGNNKASVPFYLTGSNGSQAPYYYYWETAFYFGVIGLFLAITGFFSTTDKRMKNFLIAASIFGFLYALGSNAFIFPVFFNLPFFGSFRNPARMMLFAVFAFSVLSGFGFDYLWKSAKDNKVLLKITVAAGILIFLTILIAVGEIPSVLDTPEKFVSDISSYGAYSLIFVLFASVISFLLFKQLIKPEIAGILFLIVVFIDLYSAGASFNESNQNPETIYELPKEMKEAFKPKLPNEIFRVNSRMYNPSYMAMKRSQGMLNGIMLLEGYNPLILQRVQPPLSSRELINNIYNVKYQIDLDRQNRPVFTKRDSYFPRAWTVYSYKVISPEKVEEYTKKNPIDYRKTVILEEKPNIDISENLDLPETAAFENSVQAECLTYESNNIKYNVDMEQNGFLCFSEIYYPAWKAYIDGVEAKIYRANYCFRAVGIKSGKHIVEMKYQSSTFTKGLWISIITLVLSIGGLITIFTVHKKKD